MYRENRKYYASCITVVYIWDKTTQLWNRFLIPNIARLEKRGDPYPYLEPIANLPPFVFIRNVISEVSNYEYVKSLDNFIYSLPGLLFRFTLDSIVFAEKTLGYSFYILLSPPLVIYHSTWFTYRFVQNFVFDIDTKVYNFFFPNSPLFPKKESSSKEEKKRPAALSITEIAIPIAVVALPLAFLAGKILKII